MARSSSILLPLTTAAMSAAILVATCLLSSSMAFTVPTTRNTNVLPTKVSSSRNSEASKFYMSSSDAETEEDLGLTSELERITTAFCNIGDEQVRYKQLLYMAQNTKEANNMDMSSKVPENKVPGCLSTVYVDGEAIYDQEKDDYVINFIGDSDGLLTRGLVALLVR